MPAFPVPMETWRIPVAPGVALALDHWEPEAGRRGGGPGFLLVHGLSSNARLWDGVAARLCQLGHAVAAVDLRGHGRSDKPDRGYGFAEVGDDLVAVVGALRDGKGRSAWERPVLVGQSWGANVVLELAWRRPDLAAGVVCVDGGTNDLADRFRTWEDCAAALAPPRFAGMSAADFEVLVRRLHPDWPESGIRGTLANVEDRGDGTVAPWLTLDRHLQILRALYEQRPSSRFADLQVPVLLVPADTGDPAWTAAKRAGIEAAMAAIPKARVHWFSPADHDIHAQHPGPLADLLHGAVLDGFLGVSGPG